MTFASRAATGLCIVLFLTSATAGTALDEASRTRKIEELMELTGAGEMGTQVMSSLLGPLKQAMPQVPDEWWTRFMAKVDPRDLERLVVPIYERHFTDEEIDGMLEFYRTPVGQSVIAKMPMIMQESMTAGQAWGQELAKQLFSDLKAEGYELPTSR